MTREEFREVIKKASIRVAARPEWKQNLLEKSLSPTVSIPRRPVDNQSNCDCSKRKG